MEIIVKGNNLLEQNGNTIAYIRVCSCDCACDCQCNSDIVTCLVKL